MNHSITGNVDKTTSHRKEKKMRIVIGPKEWTWKRQEGLRLFAAPIRRLSSELRFPDRRGTYQSLQDFLNAINASAGNRVRPGAFSRPVIVVRGGLPSLPCTASFADNTDRRPSALARNHKPSIQGYITARKGTWFNGWVRGQLRRRLTLDYIATPTVDYIVLR